MPADWNSVADFSQVGGVFGDFGADGVGAVGAGGPSVGDVEQHQAAVGELRELFDVFDDGAVGGRAVERDEDCVVHAFLSPCGLRGCGLKATLNF